MRISFPLFSLLVGLQGATGLFQYEDLPFVDQLEDPCQLITSQCQTPPKAPYPRTDHSAVMYRTWSLNDANILCPNLKCGPICTISNENCTSSVKRTVPDPDGKPDAIGTVYDTFCPEVCCETENCMRTRDALGEQVRFEEDVMLVFGGRAFRNVTVNGTPLFNNCTSIPHIDDNRARALDQKNKAAYVNSCGMELLNELWRYSVQSKSWTYLKPTVNRLVASSYAAPYPRYGQASVMVEVNSLDYVTKQPVRPT